MSTSAARPGSVRADEAALNDPRDGQPNARGLSMYVSLTCATAAALLAVMVSRSGGEEVDAWRLLAVVGLSLFADLPLLETRIGHSHESLTFSELCVILSIALVPLPHAVVIATACSIVFDLSRRIRWNRAAFNASNFAIAMSLAGWTAHTVAPGAVDGTSVRGVLALVLATFVFFLVNSGGVALAVSLSQRSSFLAIYREGLAMRLTIAALNALIAVLVVILAASSTVTLFMLPPVLMSMYFSYRGYVKAAHERDVWQQLESATRELNSLDVPTVVGAALSRSAQLFKADTVVVVLDEQSGATVYTGDAGGIVDSRAASGHRLGHAGDELAADDGAVTVYAEPLQGPRGRIGMLELGFRGQVQLSRREQQVLKTLAHSVSTTLQNARLYCEMRSHAEAKAYEASHDALTGLGNRSLLQERATAAIAAAAEQGRHCALLIVDLDHFKEINDTLGHAAGDVLLSQVAARVSGAVREADAVCRLGGDEFAVLLGDLPDAESVDGVATALLRVLAEPVVFDGLRLSVEGSVGIACYPDDASSFDELLQRADVALYQAKDTRGAFAHYRAERDESSLHRLALAAELRTAMAEDQLVVHFQPQHELATGALTGAEALVRWQHPERGLLAPGEFMSAVEHSGLIREFTLTVLEKATAEAAAWRRGDRPMTVAVNLSARNLLDRQLPADVARVLQRHGLEPERLVLEITETTMMSELDVVEDVLAQLRRLGVELSVDDFGTGYSSLAFLQRVQVNEVKVDRSFVAGLSTSDSARALAKATVQLAHSLGARAVGEGVENQALADVLRELGCDLAQGYHLGRPMPAQDLRRLPGVMPAVASPGRRQDGDGRHLHAVSIAPV
jgi:diguanylate cyclase (GGDEF)-like protein